MHIVYLILKSWLLILFIIFSANSSFAQDSPIDASSPLTIGNTSFDLIITTHMGDNPIFQGGDSVYFYFSHSVDAYLLFIYQDAANNFIQVFPGSTFPNSYYKAADYYLFPDAKIPFKFEISAPFGKETAWLFAANTAFPSLAGKKLDNGLKLLRVKTIDEVMKKLRRSDKEKEIVIEVAKTSFTTIK